MSLKICPSPSLSPKKELFQKPMECFKIVASDVEHNMNLESLFLSLLCCARFFFFKKKLFMWKNLLIYTFKLYKIKRLLCAKYMLRWIEKDYGNRCGLGWSPNFAPIYITVTQRVAEMFVGPQNIRIHKAELARSYVLTFVTSKTFLSCSIFFLLLIGQKLFVCSEWHMTPAQNHSKRTMGRDQINSTSLPHSALHRWKHVLCLLHSHSHIWDNFSLSPW